MSHHYQLNLLFSLFLNFINIQIQLVRKNSNMESITIATPSDINTEVKKVLRRKKKQFEVLDTPSKCLIRNYDSAING